MDFDNENLADMNERIANDSVPFYNEEESFRIFLRRFNDFGNAMNWNQEDQRRNLPSCLNESAREQLEALPEAVRAGNFIALTQVLMAELFPEERKLVARTKLLSLHQGDRSVQNFASLCQELSNMAYPIEAENDTRNENVLNAFMMGLRPKLRTAVLRLSPTNFNEAILRALHEETLAKLEGENSAVHHAIDAITDAVHGILINGDNVNTFPKDYVYNNNNNHNMPNFNNNNCHTDETNNYCSESPPFYQNREYSEYWRENPVKNQDTQHAEQESHGEFNIQHQPRGRYRQNLPQSSNNFHWDNSNDGSNNQNTQNGIRENWNARVNTVFSLTSIKSKDNSRSQKIRTSKKSAKTSLTKMLPFIGILALCLPMTQAVEVNQTDHSCVITKESISNLHKTTSESGQWIEISLKLYFSHAAMQPSTSRSSELLWNLLDCIVSKLKDKVDIFSVNEKDRGTPIQSRFGYPPWDFSLGLTTFCYNVGIPAGIIFLLILVGLMLCKFLLWIESKENVYISSRKVLLLEQNRRRPNSTKGRIMESNGLTIPTLTLYLQNANSCELHQMAIHCLKLNSNQMILKKLTADNHQMNQYSNHFIKRFSKTDHLLSTFLLDCSNVAVSRLQKYHLHICKYSFNCNYTIGRQIISNFGLPRAINTLDEVKLNSPAVFSVLERMPNVFENLKPIKLMEEVSVIYSQREIHEIQQTSDWIQRTIKKIETRNTEATSRYEVKEGILYKKPQNTTSTSLVILPEDSKITTAVIDHYHKTSYSGIHFGINKTASSIQQRFFWKRFRVDVGIFVRTCEACTLRNSKNHSTVVASRSETTNMLVSKIVPTA